MSCPDPSAIGRFLSGALDRDGTVKLLDHVRDCAGCRDALAAGSRLSVRLADASPSVAALAGTDGSGHDRGAIPRHEPPATPRFPSLLRGTGRGGWRRTIVLGGAILLLLAMQQLRHGDRAAAEAPDAADLIAAGALAEGRPWVASPRGEIGARPVVVAAILPPGERSVLLQILEDGRVLHEQRFDAAEHPGAFESSVVRTATGELPMQEALLPFPASEVLPLEPGRYYYLVLTLPNGNRSAPADLALGGR